MSELEPVKVKSDKTPRTCHTIATIGLVIVAFATVFAVAYSAMVHQDQASMVLLGTLSTGAMSALIVLSGGRNQNDR